MRCNYHRVVIRFQICIFDTLNTAVAMALQTQQML